MKSNNNNRLTSSVSDDTKSAGDDDMIGKQTVSFLTPDAISWMNKRRPNASNMKTHVNPSRVLQLRAVFNAASNKYGP